MLRACSSSLWNGLKPEPNRSSLAARQRAGGNATAKILRVCHYSVATCEKKTAAPSAQTPCTPPAVRGTDVRTVQDGVITPEQPLIFKTRLRRKSAPYFYKNLNLLTRTLAFTFIFVRCCYFRLYLTEPLHRLAAAPAKSARRPLSRVPSFVPCLIPRDCKKNNAMHKKLFSLSVSSRRQSLGKTTLKTCYLCPLASFLPYILQFVAAAV